MRFGFPGTDSVRFLDDYVLSYDRRNRTAHWVFEHLTKESLQKNDKVDRSKCTFVEDTEVHPYFQARNSDYKGSGFDRGHLAAAGNHRKCQRDVDQTFLLRPLYLPRVESDGKKYVKYQVIGANHVAVPTHFFKVVVAETENAEFDLEAYVMPNAVIDDATPLKSFLVPVETIERASGLLLFDKIGKDRLRRINGR
ncbi:hypothetical protein HPB47_012829 [Ixodes persulcatus]|uniref:Uncharacterized protein n=1 Tax=Ixodes persulcatus TaxID=34615 RepID=A0AC60NSF9_IXOPE|nr:hypothetical protein HPB47_012829 [Ixodes persulcatus]